MTSAVAFQNGLVRTSTIALSVLAGWVVVQSGSPSARLSSGFLTFILCTNLVAILCAIPYASLLGTILGVYLVGIQIVGWSLADPGEIVAALIAALFLILVIILVVRIQPSAPGIEASEGLGEARFLVWIGVFPWIPSAIGALLEGNVPVGITRLVLAGSGMAILYVTRHLAGIRLAWGMVVGTHLALVPLLFCGLSDFGTFAGDAVDRFGGGSCASVHPNLIGLAAWTVGLVWLSLAGPPLAFRLCGAIAAVGLLALTDSRTSVGAGLIALATVITVASRYRTALKSSAVRAAIGAFLIAFLFLGAWFVGRDFFVRERAPDVGVLSGRNVIWEVALEEFKAAGWPQRILGSSEGGVGGSVEVSVEESGRSTELSVDNAFLVLLRRAGIIGLLLGLTGFVRGVKATWDILSIPQAATAAGILVGAIVTTPVESLLFGGPLWVWMIVAMRIAGDCESSPLLLSERMGRGVARSGLRVAGPDLGK